MAEEDRLGPLQVREAGEHRLPFALRQGDERRDAGIDLQLPRRQLRQRPEPQIRGHLVVAAAAGVELLAEVAHAGHELPLHPAVHVLVRGVHQGVRFALRERGHLIQRRAEARQLRLRQDARAGQRRGPCVRTADVLLHQQAVEGQRVVELAEERIRLALEAAGPERRHQALPLREARCMARMRLGSEKRRMKPSEWAWS